MAIKPTHLKAAAQVLDEGDFPSALEAAKAVIAEVDALRAMDPTYVIAREWGGLKMAYGPFPTFNAGKKAVETGKAGLSVGNAWVLPLYSAAYWQQNLNDADTMPERHALHWATLREKHGVL